MAPYGLEWRTSVLALPGPSALLLVLLLLAAPGRSLAATFTVNSTADAVDVIPGNGSCATAGGVCTLRAAIQEANALAGADTINLPAGTYTLTIAGSGENASATGDLDLNSNVTLAGSGAATTVINAAGIDRIFEVVSGTSTISGMTMTGGNPGSGFGGGLLASGGSLTLSSVKVTSSTTSTNGGGIYNGATLTLIDSEVSGNNPGGNGGGIANQGILTITRSLIAGNSGANGGGIDHSGPGAALDLTNVTISANSASSSGGGLNVSRAATLTNVTIAFNSAPSGGSGIDKGGGGTASLVNAIVANNTGAPNCGFAVTNNGNNLDSAASCGFPAGSSNKNPLLGPLQDNGGPTRTHALLAGSPAIDAGTNTGAPADDQRGVARPQGAGFDIGAYEAVAYTIGGRVFEDANFAGTASDYDGGASDLGLGSVDVEIYDASTNAYIGSATTAADGTYSFGGLLDGSYKVRVRAATIGDADTPPKGGLNATVPGTWPSPLAEMTWVNGSARYGGQSATVDDTATGDNAGPGDDFVSVTVSGAAVANVNFGFAYNLIVNTTDDSNADSARSAQGTLRQFLKNANAIGTAGGTTANSSQFRMQVAANQSSGGDSWWRISTPIALPQIADGGTVVDGTTQTTSGGNTNTLGPEIEIVGNGAINGINIVSAGNTVRGLAASGYDGNQDFGGIAINGAAATGNTVAGNYLGTNATGTAAAVTVNYQGVAVNSAPGNTIGGLAAADRNVLSGNRWNGVRIKYAGATANTLAGNYIGTNAAGTAAVPNQMGVYVWDVPANLIGGTSAGATNVLSGNAQVGVYVFGANANGNVIQGNTIGLNAARTVPLPNAYAGVQFATTANNLLGGLAANAGNVIASNGTYGVLVNNAIHRKRHRLQLDPGQHRARHRSRRRRRDA